MAAIKVVKNPNNHTYPQRKPLLVFQADHAIFFRNNKWDMGNHLPNDLSCFEPVTETELQTLLDNLDSATHLFR